MKKTSIVGNARIGGQPLTQDIWFLHREKEVSLGKGRFVKNFLDQIMSKERGINDTLMYPSN